MVYVPEGVFNLDLSAQGFAVKSNHEETFSLTVDGEVIPEAPANVTVTPAAGNVESLNEIVLTFNDYETCAWTFAVAPTITLPNGETHNIKNYEFGAADNELKCTMPQTLTDEGTYVLTIPAGAVTYNDNPDNLNAAFSVTYIIKGKTADTYATASPAPGVVESLKDIYVTFNECGACAWSYKIMPTITLPDGSVKTLTSEEATYDYDNPDMRVVWLKLSEALTAPGDYVLNFPAGTLLLDEDMPSEAVSFTYTIEAGNTIDVTVNPANSAEVESLKQISVTFGDYQVVDWNWAAVRETPLIFFDSMGDPVQLTIDNLDIDSKSTNTLLITLPEEYTAVGTYSLTIPSGYVVVNTTTQETLDMDLSFSWNVEGIDVTVNPANGAEVESLKQISVTFGDYQVVDWNWAAVRETPLIFFDSMGDPVQLTIDNLDIDSKSTNTLLITLPEEYTAVGTYSLTIPSGYVVVNTTTQETLDMDLSFSWKIKGEPLTITPTPGVVDEIGMVFITFNDIDPNIGIVINQDAYNENPAVFTDKDGTQKQIGFRRITQMYPTNNTIAITLPVDDNITEVGTYKLFIPANTVYGYLDKSVVYAEDINIEWTIATPTGIYGIFAGKNEKVNVFTIDGKAVLKNADASDLKQLAPGKLYIINGKKFVVK